MPYHPKPITILMADDDEHDRRLTHEAFQEGHPLSKMLFVDDGEELLDCLRQRNRFAQNPLPRPGLILLDLNMPRMDGRAVLREIKNDPELRRIPVVIMTSSHTSEDISHTYDLGVNSYIVKPISFEALIETVATLRKYWFETVELPP